MRLGYRDTAGWEGWMPSMVDAVLGKGLAFMQEEGSG